MGIFSIWLAFLSGLGSAQINAPGVLQALKLRRLLEAKELRLKALEDRASRLSESLDRLKSSRFAQEQEVRRVLGYVTADEMIFDFSDQTGELAQLGWRGY